MDSRRQLLAQQRGDSKGRHDSRGRDPASLCTHDVDLPGSSHPRNLGETDETTIPGVVLGTAAGVFPAVKGEGVG